MEPPRTPRRWSIGCRILGLGIRPYDVCTGSRYLLGSVRANPLGHDQLLAPCVCPLVGGYEIIQGLFGGYGLVVRVCCDKTEVLRSK